VIYNPEDAESNNICASAGANVASRSKKDSAVYLQINANVTPFYDADFAAHAGAAIPHTVVAPQVEDSLTLAKLRDILMLIAVIQTIFSLLHAYELPMLPGVVRMAFGSSDFTLNANGGKTALSIPLDRSSLEMAFRAVDHCPPVDGTTVCLDDLHTTAADAGEMSFDFASKLCFHQRQEDTIHAAFHPNDKKAIRVRRTVSAIAKGGVQRLDSRVINRPIVERGRLVRLQRAGVKSSLYDLRRS
jgi:citrate lyase subunit beta/citryl-CoA lyase